MGRDDQHQALVPVAVQVLAQVGVAKLPTTGLGRVALHALQDVSLGLVGDGSELLDVRSLCNRHDASLCLKGRCNAESRRLTITSSPFYSSPHPDRCNRRTAWTLRSPLIQRVQDTMWAAVIRLKGTVQSSIA